MVCPPWDLLSGSLSFSNERMHKFLTATGWEVGTIKSKCRGAWAVKYPSEQQQYVHDLNMAEYGPDRVWLVVSRVNS